MIIGLDRTPKGRLWAAWIGNGDSANGFLMLSSSDNGGKSWSKTRLVIDPTDLPGKPNRRTLVGNLWTDPQGRLWCFFDQSLGMFDGRAGDWVTRCDNPDDANPTWSAPVRIADGCTLNKPTVLANGDWLLPVSLWTRNQINPWNRDFPDVATFRNHHRDLDAIRMANVYASSDQGKTWTRRGGVTFPGTDFDEHMIVERKDGSLWMLARAGKGISESTSTDGGRTWSTPTDSPIKNPKARFFLRRLASGNLLLVKNGPVDVAAAPSLQPHALSSRRMTVRPGARASCSTTVPRSPTPTASKHRTARSTSSTTGTATPTPRSCSRSSRKRTSPSRPRSRARS